MKNPIPLIILEIVIPLIVISLLLVNVLATRYIKAKIEKSGVIKLDLLSVNLFKGNATLKVIRIDYHDPDSSMSVTGTVNQIEIEGISIWSLITNDPIAISEVNIEEPNLTFTQLSDSTVESPKKESKVRLSIIKKVSIHDSFLQYKGVHNDSLMSHISSLTVYDLCPQDIRLNGNKYFSKLEFKAGITSYYPEGKLYRSGFNSASFSTDSSMLIIDSLAFVPLYSRQEFMQHVKYQTDEIDIQIATLNVRFNDFYNCLINKQFNGNITLQNGEINAYRDKRKPNKTGVKSKTIQQLLESVKVPINVSTLMLNSIKVTYREFAKEANEAGIVSLTIQSAKLKNILSGKQTKGELTLETNALFMKKGNMDTKLTFPYASNYFDCRGTIKDLPFDNLNPISAPNGNIVFSQGLINRLDFNFRADIDSAKGESILLYKDLNFAISKKSDGDTTGLKSKIISFVASELVVPTSNPDKNGVVQKGVIRYQRDDEKFIFNYMWKSLFSGIKSTIIRNSSQASISRKERKNKRMHHNEEKK